MKLVRVSPRHFRVQCDIGDNQQDIQELVGTGASVQLEFISITRAAKSEDITAAEFVTATQLKK
jgi:hypothetical protein